MFAFSSIPAFGSTSSPFGAHSSGFVAQSTAPTFGSTSFGQIPFWEQRSGSRVVPYISSSTNEANDCFVGWATGYLVSISAMPQYKEKSHEELRWEDYQLGDNSVCTTASLFSEPAQSSPFGQTTFGFGKESAANPLSSSLSSIFAKSKAIQPPKRPPKSSEFGRAAFGSSSGSGFSTPFGASSSTSLFGISSSPYLSSSSTKSVSLSPFRVSSTPAFSSTPFSQASQTGLFFSSTPSLGSSAFGTSKPSGNTQSSGLFQSPTSTFGQSTQSTPGFGQSTPIFLYPPAFSASSTPAFGASITTPPFGFGSISEDPDSGGVDTVSARLDKVTADMERLRLEVEALRVKRDGLQEEKDGGRDGVVVAVLEKQLRQAQQDAQYYAGEASYYHGMLRTHAPDAPVPPYSQLASHSPHAREEGSRRHEGQGESTNEPTQDHPQQ